MVKKYETRDETSYTLGMSLTIEALKGIGDKVKCVYLSKKVHQNEHLALLYELCKQYQVPVIEDDGVINSLSIKENCYCVGIFEKFQKELKEEDHVVLYRFEEEGVLGTTLRSSISFDYHDIVLIDPKVDLFDPRVVRASMGAIFHANIEVFSDLDAYFEKYPQKHTYPLLSKGSTELKKVEFTSPFRVILPYEVDALDHLFEDGIYLEHLPKGELSLATRSTLVLHALFQRKRVR